MAGLMKQSNDTISDNAPNERVGESFDYFLVSLGELAKTCNFCNNDRLQKDVHDQIIEGLHDGNTIQELLQVKDLMLDQATMKCCSL